MREQQLGITLVTIASHNHYTIDRQPQLARQWNKCVKHCLDRDSSLPLTYPTLDSGLTRLA